MKKKLKWNSRKSEWRFSPKGKFDLNLFPLSNVSCVKFIVGFKSTALKLKAVSHKKQSFPHQFDAKQMPSHAAHVLLQYYRKLEIVNLKSQHPTKKPQEKKCPPHEHPHIYEPTASATLTCIKSSSANPTKWSNTLKQFVRC